MKAYIGKNGVWRITSEPLKILEAPIECIVFANTSEEAMPLINAKIHDMGPEFSKVQTSYSYYNSPKDISEIDECVLIGDVSPERCIRLIEKYGALKVKSFHTLCRGWEDSNYNKYGLIFEHGRLDYNPAVAKKALRPTRKYVPKKNFIRIYDIRSLIWPLRSLIHRAFKTNQRISHMYLEVKVYYKSHTCNAALSLVETVNALYGKNSHRQVKEFQKFKELWKKQKPLSAKGTSVTNELFEWMEKEAKIRKPPKKELKLNKNYKL